MSAMPREPLAPKLGVDRNTLAYMLHRHGESDLADRASDFSDEEMDRIGTLGAYYAFSEDAMALGGSMGGSRALTLATIDVLDQIGRPLNCEVAGGLDVADATRDRELRRHSVERQVPADETQRFLDNLDPPAWGPAAPDATPAVRRCHELRTKPLRRFTDDDLRFMIDQQISLNQLVGRALGKLFADPLLKTERYPGDLLASVLRVDAAFWEPQFDLEFAVCNMAKGLREQPGLDPVLRTLLDTFVRAHPLRPADGIAD